MILRNDLPKAWNLLKGLKGGRVDFVLDNGQFESPTVWHWQDTARRNQGTAADTVAGFELYTDLILADFLISCTPFVSEVVFQYAIPFCPPLTLSTHRAPTPALDMIR